LPIAGRASSRLLLIAGVQESPKISVANFLAAERSLVNFSRMKESRGEAWPSLTRMLERLDFAVALPEFYVVTVHDLLGVVLGSLIVSAKKLYGPDE
jgi:hypothetical protein